MKCTNECSTPDGAIGLMITVGHRAKPASRWQLQRQTLLNGKPLPRLMVSETMTMMVLLFCGALNLYFSPAYRNA